MKSRRMLFTTAALLAALTLGACGGDDDTTSSTTGDDSSAAASTSGASADTDFKGTNSGEFCKYVQDVDKDGGFGDDFMEGTDAKSMKDDLKKAQDIYGKAIGKAPSEIKGDMQTMQKGLKAYSDLLASYDFDMTKLTAAVAKDPTIATKLTAFDTPEFSAASERVDAYFTQVCGIDTE